MFVAIAHDLVGAVSFSSPSSEAAAVIGNGAKAKRSQKNGGADQIDNFHTNFSRLSVGQTQITAGKRVGFFSKTRKGEDGSNASKKFRKPRATVLPVGYRVWP
jgi:hypothetical protein